MATITSPRPGSPATPSSRNILQSPVTQSPALTPNSSVRPSLDISPDRNGHAASPAPAAQAQRKNRAALRDYYNLKSKPAHQGNNGPERGSLSRTGSLGTVASESTITSATPTQHAHEDGATTLTARLDDVDFDADDYVKHVLKNESLKGILRIEGALVREIRELDGERKSLVYDNYSKLIRATGMIGGIRRSMNGEADGGANTFLRSRNGSDGSGGGLREMEKLRPKLEGLEKVVAELAAKRRPKQQLNSGEVRSRRAEREKRDLVEWVVESPRRFEALIAEGREDDVTSEWKVVSGLLDKWEGVKGVEELRKKCQTTLDEMEKTNEEQG